MGIEQCLRSAKNMALKFKGREILAELDPGVQCTVRSRDITGDKLKAVGVCINACADGFSQKIKWLNASRISSELRVIGPCFVEALETLSNCPKRVCTNHGAEKSLVRELLICQESKATSVEQSNTLGSWMDGMDYWVQLLRAIPESLLEVY